MQIETKYQNVFEETIQRLPNPKWERFFIGKPISTADAAHQAHR